MFDAQILSPNYVKHGASENPRPGANRIPGFLLESQPVLLPTRSSSLLWGPNSWPSTNIPGSRTFLVLVAPAWPVPPLGITTGGKAPAVPVRSVGSVEGDFPGNAGAGEAPACPCGFFVTGGTLEW